MKADNLELVITNLFSLLPLFHKKLIKPEHCVKDIDLSHSHFQIMFILNEFGVLPVSEIGKKLMISSPNMTPLIDKLIRKGLAERMPSQADRRIINIDLTTKGRGFMEEHQKILVNHLKDRLSSLEDKDLEQLAASLENIKKIFSKIN